MESKNNIMPNENPDDPNKEEALDIEGDELDKALDDILDDKKEEDDNDEGKETKTKEGDFYKKVVNREFTSEEEYDKFVLETYNTNSRFAGEIKKLGGDPKGTTEVKKEEIKEEKIEVKKEEKKEKTAEELYYQNESVKFKKQFSEANDYSDDIEFLVRKKRADINGEPSYALALAKALISDGKKPSQRLINRIKLERGDDAEQPVTSAKKIMKSGSANRAPVSPGQETYSSDELGDASDFANQVALGKIQTL